MSDKPKLKPCPFCGGEAHLLDCGCPGEFEDWVVECSVCGIAMIPPGEEDGATTTAQEAVSAWNRRADDLTLTEER